VGGRIERRAGSRQTDKKMHTHRNIQINRRQIAGQTDRNIDSWREINTYIFAHTRIHTKETRGQAEINDRNRNIQVDVRIDGCTDRRTYEQIDRQSDRHTG